MIVLLDTGGHLTHISYNFCKENGISIQPINQIVNVGGTGGDIIDYLSSIEANYPYPLVKKIILGRCPFACFTYHRLL